MTDKDVFILGAGFSKAISTQMPTMQELTNDVRSIFEANKEHGYGAPSLPPPLMVPEDSSKELENNIELWMAYLSQSQPWLDDTFNQSNKALATLIRRYIRKSIDRRTVKSMSSRSEWLDTLIQQWNQRQATVITLNYDTLVERATLSLTFPEVNGGEGIYPNQIYPPYFSNIRSRGASLGGGNTLDTFTYFKLHGSVNWLYSGRDDFFGETIFYSDVSSWGSTTEDFERDSRISAGDKQSLIIPPAAEKTTYFNNETVRRLWYEASEALESATRVFVIGYSLPMSDLGMRFFLKRSLPIRKTRWYIVDTNDDIARTYCELLAPQQAILDEFAGGEDPVCRFVGAYPTLPSGYGPIC